MLVLFRRFSRFFIPCSLLALAGLTSCTSTSFLTRSDYRPSVEALRKEGPAQAEKLLPSGEQGTFIKIMEETYLALLQGRPDIDELRDFAAKVDHSVRIRVSEELSFFFYIETPEGYFASEHEIIWMHMLLSWGYSLRGETDSAVVEAKKAALLLEGKARAGRFDDPMLRVMLAALWMMCDRWEDARVDFRVAVRLDPSLRWAAALSELSAPPERLTIVLTGTGPEPYWKPEMQMNPLRGMRDLEFRSQSREKRLAFFDASGRALAAHRSPHSHPWYARHLKRNNVIREALDDSRYGQRVLVSTAKGTAKAGAGITVGIVGTVLSIGVGGAIIYYGHDSQEAVAVGLFIAIKGTQWSYEFARDMVKDSVSTALDEFDISDRYRYVRFLPERAHLVVGGHGQIRVWDGRQMQTIEERPNAPQGVSIHYVPDGD
jgi:hypothetical protein